MTRRSSAAPTEARRPGRARAQQRDAGSRRSASAGSSATTGGRVLRIVLFFAVPCIVAMAVLRVIAPPNPDFVFHLTLTSKIDHLNQTDEHYDLVLVGDSRVFRGIDPGIVETELARLGCPANTYNMGSVAQTKMEFDHVMDVLDGAPAGTPEIIVSFDALTLLAGVLKDFSLRHRVHMNASDVATYLEYKANLPREDFDTDVLELADTAAAFALNQVPVGAVHQQLFDQVPTQEDIRLATELDGFQPWAEFHEDAGEEGMANLFATLEPELRNGGWERRWAAEELSADRLDSWIETVAAHIDAMPEDATRVHAFMPSFYDAGTTASVVEGWVASGRTEPIINLVDENVVGDYTDPSYFLDFWHLSETGSVAVSTALAEQLCPIVREATEG